MNPQGNGQRGVSSKAVLGGYNNSKKYSKSSNSGYHGGGALGWNEEGATPSSSQVRHGSESRQQQITSPNGKGKQNGWNAQNTEFVSGNRNGHSGQSTQVQGGNGYGRGRPNTRFGDGNGIGHGGQITQFKGANGYGRSLPNTQFGGGNGSGPSGHNTQFQGGNGYGRDAQSTQLQSRNEIERRQNTQFRGENGSGRNYRNPQFEDADESSGQKLQFRNRDGSVRICQNTSVPLGNESGHTSQNTQFQNGNGRGRGSQISQSQNGNGRGNQNSQFQDGNGRGRGSKNFVFQDGSGQMNPFQFGNKNNPPAVSEPEEKWVASANSGPPSHAQLQKIVAGFEESRRACLGNQLFFEERLRQIQRSDPFKGLISDEYLPNFAHPNHLYYRTPPRGGPK